MKVAIIPARGGSKRILKKNIKSFLGKPIIAYSIEAALQSQCFDRVIVSTDDDEIAQVALSCGAEVPFIRPKDISDDFTGTNAVVAHALNQLNVEATLACCIYATSPLISIATIKRGESILSSDKSLDYAVTVTPSPYPLNRAMEINENSNRLKMSQLEHLTTRTQDLKESYFDAGQIYWGKAQAFVQNSAMFYEKTAPIIIPNHLVQDIDTEEDWLQAELKYRIIQEQHLLG